MTRERPGLHRSVWRWHFYAGLFVAPVLLVLALTGAIYLFNTEINDAIYPGLQFSGPEAPSLPLSRLLEAAEQAFPGGEATRIDLPVEAHRSAEVFLTPAAGEPVRVFVAPQTGAVLGSYVYARTLVGIADVLHGSLMLGKVGDAIVELAACWGLILVCTGFYLWLPRGGRAAVWVPRLASRGRRLWRDLHQVFGLYTAVLVLFLILTGLPWATIWGGQFLAPLSNAAGLGYPEGARRALQSSTAMTVGQAVGDTPWTLHHAPMPQSRSEAASAPPPIGVDAAAQVLAEAGMTSAYRLFLPRGVRGVYMAYAYPDQPQGQRTLQIDQYSGAILGDIGFADYGAIAKAVEWGVALHLGNYFGRLNQLVMLLPCIGIVGLVVSGSVMWWRRRPAGTLGAPPRPTQRRLGTGIWAIILTLGIVFPLAGLSMVLVGAMDRLLVTRRRGSA